jgi:hypothetical protein
MLEEEAVLAALIQHTADILRQDVPSARVANFRYAGSLLTRQFYSRCACIKDNSVGHRPAESFLRTISFS